MTAVFSLVICEIIYNDGRVETEYITYKEYSVLLASVDTFSVVDHLKSIKQNVSDILVKEVLYFKTQQDYDNYIETLK